MARFTHSFTHNWGASDSYHRPISNSQSFSQSKNPVAFPISTIFFHPPFFAFLFQTHFALIVCFHGNFVVLLKCHFCSRQHEHDFCPIYTGLIWVTTKDSLTAASLFAQFCTTRAKVLSWPVLTLMAVLAQQSWQSTFDPKLFSFKKGRPLSLCIFCIVFPKGRKKKMEKMKKEGLIKKGSLHHSWFLKVLIGRISFRFICNKVDQGVINFPLPALRHDLPEEVAHRGLFVMPANRLLSY